VDQNTRQEVIKITARVVDTRTSDTVREIPAKVVRDNQTLIQFTAPTVHLGPGTDDPTANQLLRHANENPKVDVARSLIRSKPDSPFAVEVLVLPRSDPEFLNQPLEKLIAQATAREANVNDGRAFVPLKLGECYMIRLHNKADHETAVAVSVDGLDLFQFAEQKNETTGRSFTHSIIDKGATRVIAGWFRTLNRSDAFVTTEYGKGEASKFLRGSPKIGTITVTFSASWEKDKDMPQDEAVKGQLETKIGPPIRTGETAVLRTIGKVRDVVSVRYSKES
jgi:hypothetical protein